MTSAILFFIFSLSLQPATPDTLTLEYCYNKIEEEYPLAKKVELQDEVTELNKKIAQRASYPQLSLNAAATYQSEVTEFEVPAGGQSVGPDLSRDQYNASLEITQPIYYGGKVGIRKKMEAIRGRQQQQEVEAQLHQVKEQINQVYFGILLAERQLEITETLSDDIRSQIKTVESRVRNGVLLLSQQKILQAELITIQQDSAEIVSNIQSGFKVLSQLIGEEVNPQIQLEMPDAELSYQTVDSLPQFRPEFKLFESNRQALNFQKELAQTDKWPSLSAFGTAAYGRLGYNVFDDELHPYYLIGLRVQWNFWDSRNAKLQQRVYNLQQKNILEEESAFERQVKASLNKIEEEIQALHEKIKRDEEITDLRKEVVDEVSSQMENGAATATEYISELNKMTQAQLSMMINKTKLAQAKVDYQTVLGISNKQ